LTKTLGRTGVKGWHGTAGVAMNPSWREMRIGNLTTKIAECQQEWTALARKSSSSYLTPEERTAISRIQEQTIEQCGSLQYLLGLHEHQV
jgi:hypothetical protein